MAQANDDGGITLDNNEAIWVAFCIAVAQAVVFGKSEMVRIAANTLKDRMLRMHSEEMNAVTEEFKKCVEKDPRYTYDFVDANKEDLRRTKVMGGMEIKEKPPKPELN